MSLKVISQNTSWNYSNLFYALFKTLTSSGSFFSGICDISDLLPFIKTPILGFSSGRGALFFILSLLSQQKKRRDEVVLPFYVCRGVLEPVMKAGLKPIFCDIRNDLNLDVKSCVSCFTDRTLAVIVPHTYGYPAEIGKIKIEIQLSDPEIYLIDDGACGMGTYSNGVPLGLSGDVGIFSLNQAKAYSATGGGFLAITNKDLYLKALDDFVNIPSIGLISKLYEAIKFTYAYKAINLSKYLNYYLQKLFKISVNKPTNAYNLKLSPFDLFLLYNSAFVAESAHAARLKIINYYISELASDMNMQIIHIDPPKYLSRFGVVIPGINNYENRKKCNMFSKWENDGIFFQRGYQLAFENIIVGKYQQSLAYVKDIVILPVNHTLPPEKHSRVVNAIKEIASCV